jgi:hypothetical protein
MLKKERRNTNPRLDNLVLMLGFIDLETGEIAVTKELLQFNKYKVLNWLQQRA